MGVRFNGVKPHNVQGLLKIGRYNEKPVWDKLQDIFLGVAQYGADFSVALRATDSNLDHYELESGSSLPAGLTLNPKTGVISGKAIANGGVLSFTVRAVDALGMYTTKTFQIQLVGKSAFGYTGSNQTYIVPDNVTSVTVHLWGGGGGNAQQTVGSNTYNWPGGYGAYSRKVLAVTPGTVLTVQVAGNGVFSNGGGVGAGLGGWPNGQNSVSGVAGGGGGSTRILINGTIVACAGGGCGAWHSGYWPGPKGKDAGPAYLGTSGATAGGWGADYSNPGIPGGSIGDTILTLGADQTHYPGNSVAYNQNRGYAVIT